MWCILITLQIRSSPSPEFSATAETLGIRYSMNVLSNKIRSLTSGPSLVSINNLLKYNKFT